MRRLLLALLLLIAWPCAAAEVAMLGVTQLSGFGAGGASILPTDITGLKAWYRADLGVTKDGSNLVASWADQAAVVGAVTEGTNKPLWVASAVNGQPAIRFDGVNDILTSGAFSAIAGPHHIFMIFKQASWSSGERIFTADAGGSAVLMVYQVGSTPNLSQFISTGANAVSATLDTYFLLQSYLEAGSTASFQSLNAGAKVTGSSPGTASSPTRLALGGQAGQSFNTQIEIAEFIWYAGAEITGSNLTNLMSYLQTRYGLW
jgi:hypothetical protein